jgi:hypothetical protein
MQITAGKLQVVSANLVKVFYQGKELDNITYLDTDTGIARFYRKDKNGKLMLDTSSTPATVFIDEVQLDVDYLDVYLHKARLT